MDDRPVDRCICHDVPFAQLISLQQATGGDLKQLQKSTGAGTGCGLCLPYIKAALATRCPRFAVLSEQALAALCTSAGEKHPR